ncbi:twin-arginine translocase TatA/TatE family subunit [Leucobacter sp. gxy201]|uniref:twin-arginine translocase TatA/TatE family subunit n=1 Tax=Leucobacter sp. gxy201 TaxID=2957200 RepID=UPI003DA07F4A
MLQGLTGWHLIVILFIILLLFGAPKLPGLAKSLGQSMKILKKEVRNDEDGKAENSADADVETAGTAPAAAAPAAPVAPTAPATPAAPVADADAEIARARAEAEAAKAELEALKLQAQADKRSQAGE